MKTKLFNILLLLLLFPVLAIAGEVNGRYEKEKKISKSYTVNGNAGLTVKNKYGNVFVTTWDENKTVIDVVISVSGNNEDKVNERLNSIDVLIDGDKEKVSAVTKIGNFSGRNISMEINYTIKIPKQGGVNINNEYGGIMLGKIFGESYLVCKYGDLKIDELNNKRNVIDIEYCGISKIGFINNGKIAAKYSGISVANGNYIDLVTDYTDVVLSNVDEAVYKCSYGDINIGNGGKVFGVGNYQHTEIGNITEKLNLTTNYGDVNVQSIDPSANSVYITTTYTTTKLGYKEKYAFDFEVSLQYGSLQGAGGMNFQKKEEKHTSSYYKGYNIASGKNSIVIKSEYGDIKFIKS